MTPDDKQRAPADRRPGQLPPLCRLGTAALAMALALAAQSVEAKRLAPADVPPVVVGDLRYEVPGMGTPLGDAHNGGVVVARRADSGDLVWTRRVYVVGRNPHREGDVQDVFIKSLTLAPDGRHLDVVNERGKRFELDLDGGHVRAIP